jgi:hypothetical protein
VLKRIRFADAPPDDRAVRAVRCTALPDLAPDPRHGTVVFEWFADGVDPGGDGLVVEERVVRGADWLERRWREATPVFKHIALAQRASGLTQAAFSERWAQHAGTVGSRPIPDEVRGLAYVQNHPVPGDWPYDAVNEVYFDDIDILRTRIAFFEDAPTDELFGAHWFLAVREEVVVSD